MIHLAVYLSLHPHNGKNHRNKNITNCSIFILFICIVGDPVSCDKFCTTMIVFKLFTIYLNPNTQQRHVYVFWILCHCTSNNNNNKTIAMKSIPHLMQTTSNYDDTDDCNTTIDTIENNYSCSTSITCGRGTINKIRCCIAQRMIL